MGEVGGTLKNSAGDVMIKLNVELNDLVCKVEVFIRRDCLPNYPIHKTTVFDDGIMKLL